MSAPLKLVICIPTYNRAACLRRLLGTLERELAGLEQVVGVLVADNASPDDTPQVVREFEGRIPGLASVRRAQNVGPDENFCRCVEQVTSDYFWIMGDDDLPRAGAIALLVRLLQQRSPDIVKLRAWGRDDLQHNDPHDPVRRLDVVAADAVEFARRVNVHLTFISAIILRRATFTAGADGALLRRYDGSRLSQLSWVLPTLQNGQRLMDVTTICILSQSGNSGGYGLLEVFGRNFPRVVRQQFGAGSAVSEAIVGRYLIEFLPHAIWRMRIGTAGEFSQEEARPVLEPELGRHVMFPLLVAVASWPRPLAAALRFMLRALGWTLRQGDRLRARPRAFAIE